jgi:ferredoxin
MEVHPVKIVVDPDRCACFSMCTAIAPDLFQIGEAGHVEILAAEPPEALHEAAEDACDACPNQALTIIE